MAFDPRQSRAARGWLDWSQAELATRAGVGLSTVRDFEKGRHRLRQAHEDRILEVFAGAGIEFQFTVDGSPAGVRKRPSS